MTKHTFRPSRTISRSTPWHMLRSALGVVGIFVAMVIAWWYANEIIHIAPSRFGGSLLLFLFYTLFAITIERSAFLTPIRRDWRYRVSFLIPSLEYLSIWFIILVKTGELVSVVWLIAAIGGAFAGSILATGMREGIWEDNSPPSERVQRNVHQRHVDIIGKPGRTSIGKRSFDFLLSICGLIISVPVWLVMTFLLWLEDPGPLLFVKNSVGKGGVNFHQYKFRTMVRGAESKTGPVPASQEDERVLIIGSLLRKTALDELPQLINILKGEMSYVGPRPQRTVLVEGYLDEMPQYAQRHLVLPGLSGLAQVAGDYYLTPHQKLRFDRLYIRNASLGFDIQLLILAFLITFWYRWQSDWNGRLPRRLLHQGRRKTQG